MTRRSVRDNWLAAVMYSAQLGDACRRILAFYAMAGDARGPWMNEKGRIRPVTHKAVGEALGIAEKTVTNRILEATKKGFLVKDPTTGHRGRAAAYQATFPPVARATGPISLRALVPGALKVPVNEEPFPPGIREPFPPDQDRKVPAIGDTQRAPARTRATSRTRADQPAPADGRGPEPHHFRNYRSSKKRAPRLVLVAACPSRTTTTTGDTRCA